MILLSIHLILTDAVVRATPSPGLRGRHHHQQAEDGQGDAGRGGGGVQEGPVSPWPGVRQDVSQQQRPLSLLRSSEPMLLRLLDLYNNFIISTTI